MRQRGRRPDRRWGSGRASRRWRALGALLVAVPLAGCVGSKTQEDFEDEVHARGGGLSQQLALDAVDEVEQELHVDTIKLRSLGLTPGHVTLEIQVPHTVEDLDSYGFGTSGMYGGGGLSGPEPVARSFDEAALESQVFTLDQAGIAHLDLAVDAAIAAAEIEGGYATAATVTRLPGQEAPQTSVTVTNVRRTVTVNCAPDGSVLEVLR